MEHLGLGRLYNVPRLNLNYVCICAARNNAKHDSSPYWSILMYIYIYAYGSYPNSWGLSDAPTYDSS